MTFMNILRKKVASPNHLEVPYKLRPGRFLIALTVKAPHMRGEKKNKNGTSKFLEKVLLAANGSRYVIEFIISQYLSIVRIQKYFLHFFILYGFRAAARTKCLE